MATIPRRAAPGLLDLSLRRLGDVMAEFGDLSAFAGEVMALTFRRPPRGAVTPIFFAVGVRSIPVVAVTGLFIGMVLAVQSYGEFHAAGLASQLGSIINMSVVRELGPVLAATMLAGRVGGAMAAELATMRITEQIDAMACLGVNPVHRLAVPRFVACVLLIPLLTTVANFMGVMGGALVCTQVYNIDAHFYWHNAEGYVTLWDLGVGLIKPMFFGGAIAIIGCHRGFHSTAGAEGVGRAATRAFVASFIAILALDFFLALFFNNLYGVLWPTGGKGAL
jgi:phospholipid/cholesterol/gamma-HCH transport system permease protein